MIKHIANILTGCRIFGSILLMFFPMFSVEFYIIYILCGFSDMIDGTIARKTNSTSKFGSQLDTIADLIFVAVALFRLLPVIHIPEWLWIWGGVIAVFKISNIILGYVSKKEVYVSAYDHEQSNGTIAVPIAFDNILRGIEIYCHSCMLHCNTFCNSRRVLYYYR